MADRTFLVVDDDPFQLDLLSELVGAQEPARVTVAGSGAEGLRAVRDEAPPFDVILCDLQMPDMDGVEFMRHLGAAGCRSQVVVVTGAGQRVLTAAMAVARERGLRVGGGLTKPVSWAALAELLDREAEDAPVPTPLAIHPGELEQAIGGGELFLHYQPRVAVRDRKVTGVECLVRWNHPLRGPVPPAALIDLAERAGLIDAVTDRVLELALRQAACWQGRGMELPVAVNLSMDNLHDLHLPVRLLERTRAAGLAPEQLTLEVTESRLAEDTTNAREILTRLRLAGFPLAMDDFGTGYSSLKQLAEMPFSELKIDRMFVAGAQTDPARRALLEASARIGRELGLRVVAEGVETPRQWELAAGAGCDEVQGWLLARPMAAPALESWLKERGHPCPGG